MVMQLEQGAGKAVGLSLKHLNEATGTDVQVVLDSLFSTKEMLKYTTTITGFGIPFDMSLLRVYVRSQVTFLYHVKGNLYVIASHYAKTGSTSLYLLDSKGSTLEDNTLSPDASLRAVIKEFKKHVVKSYYYKAKWRVLRLSV